MSISRREFLSGASALGASAALGTTGVTALTGCRHQARPVAAVMMPPGTPAGMALVPPQLATIREAGASRNLLAGCAVNVKLLGTETAYAQLIRQQADIVVAEDAMKFGPLRPTPDTFFFEDADFLFGFAAANGMAVRGHNFAWHCQLPPWFAGYVNRTNAEAILTQHIETVAGRYAGRVHSWDVVNEAILVEDGLPGGLRHSPWYALLGPGYIDLAFRTAKRADPGALLCLNEYGIEGERPEDERKRVALLALLRGMQSRGVPIDAVGIQSHIVGGPAYACGPGLGRFMGQAQAMGLKLLITEFDVNDRFLPGVALDVRDRAIAAAYRDYLNLTLANPEVIALLTWGITDKWTWLNKRDARIDGLGERGLPFDADLRPTPAYSAEVAAIQAAAKRV